MLEMLSEISSIYKIMIKSLLKYYKYKSRRYVLYLLRRIIPNTINKIDDPRNVATLCKNCNEFIPGIAYHLGFSNLNIFYCSQCNSSLLIDTYDSVFDKYESLNKTPFQYYCRNKIPYWDAIASEFKHCNCGGFFHYMNPPRCPKCNGLIFGDCYEDKPILKEQDIYTFITGTVYKGENHKKK